MTEKTSLVLWKVYLPSVHAAEAMAEALSVGGFKVGWGGKDYIVGLEASEFDAVVEEVKKYHHHFHAARIDKDLPNYKLQQPRSEGRKTDFACWNCGKDGTVMAEVLGSQYKCSACGAFGDKEDYD